MMDEMEETHICTTNQCSRDRTLNAGGSFTEAIPTLALLREIQATKHWTKLIFIYKIFSNITARKEKLKYHVHTQ